MPPARAVRIREAGEVDVLEIADVSVRDPGPGEVLVSVAAAGLNRADVLQRRGLYPAPPGIAKDIPGLEYAGTVAAIGDGVSAWATGDRVMGILGGGAMATLVIADEREVIRVPVGTSLTDAAAVPEAFMTAYDAVQVQGGARMGDVVLVHAVGSGVGTACVQLCAAAGVRVVGTARAEDKLSRCVPLGLWRGLMVSDGTFAERVLSVTDGRGADVVLDPVGGNYLAEDLRAVAPRGRIVVIGSMGGGVSEIPLGLLLHRRATVTGSVLRGRPSEQKATLAQDFARQVVPLFVSGRLQAVVDTVMPMTDIAEAHRRMERNETFGKIVLTW